MTTTSPVARPTMGYRPAFDGLRAVAIGLVLLEHTGLELFDGGNSGVILFFILSGFLITKLMLEEWGTTGRLDIRAFYGRRTVRIMPAPLVMVLVVFALSWQLEPAAADRRYLWFELALVVLYIYSLRPLLFADGGWFGAERTAETTTYMTHTWSLAVEEHFYLVWPWVLRGLRLPDRRPLGVVRVLVGSVVVIGVARFALDRYVDPDLVSISLFTFDGFALGAALAFVIHHELWAALRALLVAWWVPLIAGAVLLADLLLRDQRDDGSYGYWYISYTAVAGAALIGSVYGAERRSPLTWVLSLPPMVYIGKLSYSLYLWHVPVQVYFSTERFPTWSTAQVVVVEQVVTVVAVLASYYLVEMPARRWRRHFTVQHAVVQPRAA